MLSGKYLNGARPEGARLTIETRPDHRAHPNTEAAIQFYVDLASDYELDACQMALAFVNDRPFVTSTLIGATNMTQLKNNIASIDLELSDEVYEKIKDIRRDIPMPF